MFAKHKVCQQFHFLLLVRYIVKCYLCKVDRLCLTSLYQHDLLSVELMTGMWAPLLVILEEQERLREHNTLLSLT